MRETTDRRWLLLLALVLVAGCRTRIHHGLDEREANELQAALQAAGLDADKVAETGRKPTWAIEVPDDQQMAAVRHLEALGLPRRRLEGMARVLASPSMVPTPTEERLKEGHLLSEQAVLAIEQVEGVAHARVQLSLSTAPRGGQPRGPAKASALVKARPGALPQVLSMRQAIQELVAGGVEGLAAADVTVVVQELSTPASAAIPNHGSTDTLLRVALALCAALVAGLAVALLVLTLRLRRTRSPEVTVLQPVTPLPARPRVAGAPGSRPTRGLAAAREGGAP